MRTRRRATRRTGCGASAPWRGGDAVAGRSAARIGCSTHRGRTQASRRRSVLSRRSAGSIIRAVSREDDDFIRQYEGFVRGVVLHTRGQLGLETDPEDLIAYGSRGFSRRGRASRRSRLPSPRGASRASTTPPHAPWSRARRRSQRVTGNASRRSMRRTSATSIEPGWPRSSPTEPPGSHSGKITGSPLYVLELYP